MNEENDNEDVPALIITKCDLCSALRKFIIRYLIEGGDNQINIKNNLKNYLVNSDLWPIYFIENNIIDEEIIEEIFGDINVEIIQAVKLYEYLGGEKSELEKLSLTYNINLNINDEKRKIDAKDIYNGEAIRNSIIYGENNINGEEQEEEQEEDEDDEENQDY